jgi:hypothetical protein
MIYHDDIITIKLCRGELATSLGERGLMVKNWKRFTTALEKELVRETPSHDDGHTGSSAVGDLLVQRLIDRYMLDSDGLREKPYNGKHECWPFEEKWFT